MYENGAPAPRPPLLLTAATGWQSRGRGRMVDRFDGKSSFFGSDFPSLVPTLAPSGAHGAISDATALPKPEFF